MIETFTFQPQKLCSYCTCSLTSLKSFSIFTMNKALAHIYLVLVIATVFLCQEICNVPHLFPVVWWEGAIIYCCNVLFSVFFVVFGILHLTS